MSMRPLLTTINKKPRRTDIFVLSFVRRTGGEESVRSTGKGWVSQ